VSFLVYPNPEAVVTRIGPGKIYAENPDKMEKIFRLGENLLRDFTSVPGFQCMGPSLVNVDTVQFKSLRVVGK